MGLSLDAIRGILADPEDTAALTCLLAEQERMLAAKRDDAMRMLDAVRALSASAGSGKPLSRTPDLDLEVEHPGFTLHLGSRAHPLDSDPLPLSSMRQSFQGNVCSFPGRPFQERPLRPRPVPRLPALRGEKLVRGKQPRRGARAHDSVGGVPITCTFNPSAAGKQRNCRDQAYPTPLKTILRKEIKREKTHTTHDARYAAHIGGEEGENMCTIG